MAAGRRGQTIEFRDLAKSYGEMVAVDGITADVRPGRVTAFLGPNGAGKTTTLRMLLGLVHPTHGSATFGGVRYGDLNNPVLEIGALVESAGFHPDRTALDHLRVLAVAAQLDPAAPQHVLAITEMAPAADRRVGEFSLGMRQRLALAAALLGDPDVLVLDEPTNGLDPPGIRWLRRFLRDFANDGGTVLLSSHALSEVEQIADDVLIISRGRIVHAGGLADLAAAHGCRLQRLDDGTTTLEDVFLRLVEEIPA